MKLNFIPIDYSYFDFEGRNYAKIIGRDENEKRVCIIDSCPVYLLAILKESVSKNQIKKLIEEIEKIKKEARIFHKKIKILNIKKAGEIAPYKIRLRVDFEIL